MPFQVYTWYLRNTVQRGTWPRHLIYLKHKSQCILAKVLIECRTVLGADEVEVIRTMVMARKMGLCCRYCHTQSNAGVWCHCNSTNCHYQNKRGHQIYHPASNQQHDKQNRSVWLINTFWALNALL